MLLLPLTPWHYFLRQIPHTFAAANSLHTARQCTTQKAKSFFLHLTLFDYFTLIINKLHSVRWFQSILHYPTPHLTLSYTAYYTEIWHLTNRPSGRRPRSNGHTECGHRGSGKYDAPTDFSASRWCAAALAQRIFPSAWHLVCKRRVR